MTEMLSIASGIPPDAFHGSKIGLEKEGLRIGIDGRLSSRPHPHTLGAALTHPSITTDFSEALLELITPPSASAGDALRFLDETHTFVHHRLIDETIWSASMPCPVESESEIPIAFYGSSDAGMAKQVYRRGLAYRYGRMMQLIAGVHFNYSFADELWPALQALMGDTGDLQSFIAERYMATLRNVRRYDWLLVYLFGASPAAHIGFTGAADKLQRFDRETGYAPYATSLRMGDMGYSNRLPAGYGVHIDCNSLAAYIESMQRALETPHPPYEAIGLMVDGEHRQLNTHLLQIEGEYYTSVRPKQIPQADESALAALQRGGIRYLELRAIDISPFTPAGVTLEQLQFLELFVNFCLLRKSPPLDRRAAEESRRNLNLTAYRGRDPSLELTRNGVPASLRDWGKQLFDGMETLAGLLDGARGGQDYRDTLEMHRRLLDNPEQTPSAWLLAAMEERGESYAQWVLQQSQMYHAHYRAKELSTPRLEYYEALSRHSLRQQGHLERCSHGLFGPHGPERLAAKIRTYCCPKPCASCKP